MKKIVVAVIILFDFQGECPPEFFGDMFACIVTETVESEFLHPVHSRVGHHFHHFRTLNTERWDDQRLTTWFDTFMPTIDYSNPKVVEMMTDSAIYWLKEFNLDGFRHDACKHVNLEFWRLLTLKMKQNFPDNMNYQIGET
jgi:glycosidase